MILLTGVCHDIYGTDGAQYPPFVVKDETKWVFVSQLCRSIWLDFDEEVDVRGIEAYRYRPPFSVYDMRSPGTHKIGKFATNWHTVFPCIVSNPWIVSSLE